MIGWLVAVVMVAELGLHYFPWRMFLRGKELPRLVAYVLGVLGLMVPFSAWLWQRGEVDVIKVLWMVIGAGGLTVMALYGLDRWLDLEMRNIEAADRERLLLGQVKDVKSK